MTQVKNPTNFYELLGGDAGINEYVNAFTASGPPKGVHSLNPGCTPKYRTSVEGATETMARIMVPFSSTPVRDRFIRSLPSGDARTLGKALAVTDKSSKGTTGGAGLGYIDFLLQTAQESYAEKVQVVDVLSDNYIAYFFGQEPPVFAYQGTLLNTYQDDWRSAFTIIYGEILRGTKLARRRRLMTLTYDNVAITGSIINMSQTLTADMEMAASFTFNLLVKRYDVYRLPHATFNPPTQFTNVLGKLIDPNTFTGLKLGGVKRTYREVGFPQVATSVPKKDKGETESDETDTTLPGDSGDAGNIRNPKPTQGSEPTANDALLRRNQR